MTEATRLLGGRYELGETLGYGGMAEVYAGRDVRLGREVAIKVLRADLARDPSFLHRFRREAQAAASLNHPMIVSVYDTGEDEGTPYIVMEYVEGRTLRDVVHGEGPLLPQRAVEIVADVCAALEYSHQAGIVHRDVKPGNVMLTPAGDIKVMDFGIARAVTASSTTMTQTAAVMGTAQYLSPEQARGEHVDARSDVYSTGCLLYELLTGVPPFTGDSPVAVAYQHVREDPSPPSQTAPDVPGSVDAIVLKAMSKNPANRYQSAEEMRADLERAANGRPVEATPVLVEPTVAIPAAATTTLLRPVDGDPPDRKGLRRALIALAILALFVLVALVTKSLVGTTSTTRVATPNVIGLSEAQATERLTAARLKVGKIDREFNDKQPAGSVFDQNPTQDVQSVSGGSVDLKVSKGIEMVAVPQVVGLSQPDARQRLTDAKLTIGKLVTSDKNAAPDTVLAIDPAPGTSLAAGSPVTLTVSSGQVGVPNVVGQDQSTATQTLENAGFQVMVTNTPNGTVPPNRVVSQSPGGGRSAARGTQVTIVVAQPLPPTPTPTPTAPAPPAPSLSLTPTPSP